MASTVACSLHMYESNIPDTQTNYSPVTKAIGMIKILLQQQHQSSNMATEYGEIFIPQTSHAVFYIPYETLFDQESRQLYIWNVLSSALNVDSHAVCKYLTPRISAFAVWTAERSGIKGFSMVAEVCLSDDS